MKFEIKIGRLIVEHFAVSDPATWNFYCPYTHLPTHIEKNVLWMRLVHRALERAEDKKPGQSFSAKLNRNNNVI